MKAEAAARVEATIAKEAAEQALHTCTQEASRLGTAHRGAAAEEANCEERLVKQDAWAASLSATNSVLREHLREVTHTGSTSER